MRSYILKTRTIEDHERPLVGTWRIKETVYFDGRVNPNSGTMSFYEFKSDGTFEITRDGSVEREGMWKYNNNVISVDFLESLAGIREIHWILDEFTPERFVVGGRTKLVYIRE